MKKLKIILAFKYFVILIFLLSTLYTLYITKNKIYKSKYNNDNFIEGTIINLKKTEYGSKIIIKGKEKIIANYYDENELKVGDIVRIKGTLEQPKTNTNFNLFNYQKYLLSQKIYWTLQIESLEIIGYDNIYHFKNNTYNYLSKIKNSEYILAFVFGDKNMMENEDYQMYQKLGVSHLLATSGMHVSLFAAILLFLFKKIFNSNISHILTILFLILYILLFNNTVSVIRAVLLFVLLYLNKLFELKIESLYYLGFIFSILLLINPYNIYNIGFQFSFVISAFLILYNKLIKNKKNYLIKSIIISYIAFVASFPIVINNYFEINILSIISNLVLVPFTSFIVIPFSILLIFIPYLDFIYEIIIKILESLTYFLSNTSLILTFKKMSYVLIVIYYLIVIYSLSRKKYLLVLIFIIFNLYSNIFQNYSYITMVDVNNGDSILISLKNNQGNILIDTGGEINYNVTKNSVIPYLKSEGIRTIDYLIITHGDYDHIGGSIEVLNNFKVKNIFINSSLDNELEKELIEKYNAIKIDKLNLKINDYTFSINSYDSKNENNNSLIIKANIDNKKILFMGDATKEEEIKLLNEYNYHNLDILKIGHHGSKTSTSNVFLKKINPYVSLISVGLKNRYNHPSIETLENLKNYKTFLTSINGSTKIILKNNLEIYTCK